MRSNVKTAAYGLLKTLTPVEVAELIEVLTYYNDTCKEDCRAECLSGGCKKTDRPLLEEKTAGSTDIYLSGGTSVCPCCRK